MQYPQKFFVALTAIVVVFSGLEAIAQTAGTSAAAEPDLKLFAVEITVGPNWDTAKAPNEQAFFKEHSVNLKNLRTEGHIVMGARYSDKGLIIFSAATAEEVTALMNQDPAMTAGTFVFEVHAFSVFYPGLVQAK